MSPRRIAVAAVSGALLAGGAGVAIAAVSKGEGKKSEQAVLDDAAKRLGVSTQKLHDALAAAQDTQLDQAVKDGRLTQKQADAIKARRKQSGRVLGGGPGPGGPGMHRFGGPGGPGGPGALGVPGGPGGPGPGFRGRGRVLGPVGLDLAKALGLTRAQLRDQLRAGKSIADVAKAKGKSLDDVRSAVKADAKTKADKAVADGDLTRKQAGELLSLLDDRLGHLGEAGGTLPRMHRRGAPNLRPGSVVPGVDELPLPPAADGVFS